MSLIDMCTLPDPEMPEPLKRVIRQEPRVLVHVDALTPDSREVKHEYVVQDDACHTALQVGWLARLHGVFPTRMYGRERTVRPLNPLLAAYPGVIFNEGVPK